MALAAATGPSATLSRATAIRVASVPSSHVYVRHLAAPEQDEPDSVVRLPDPPPRRADDAPGWWPPAVLDPAWIRRHRDEFDVFHVHFGFDALAPAELLEIVETLRELDKPLVHTVHDLRNPHHRTSQVHDAQLDVLVPAADTVVTLTPGAADEIARRWGRRATVLPHPHVVEPADMRRLARDRVAPALEDAEFRVGLHVKSLRSCMDPWAVLPVLVDAVREIPGGVLQVDGHTDVLDRDGARFDSELAAALADTPDCVDVRVHDYFSDSELVDYLAALDLSVLPYRFGTHSGWLEACRDLGTPVAAPTCGFYDEQGPVHSFAMDEDHLDAESLTSAVASAFEQTPIPAATVTERLHQRRRLSAEHTALYADLLGGAGRRH